MTRFSTHFTWHPIRAKASDLRPEKQELPQTKPFVPVGLAEAVLLLRFPIILSVHQQEEIYANFLQTIRLFSYLESHVVREMAKDALQVRMLQVADAMWCAWRISQHD